jgi:hypothetical protein
MERTSVVSTSIASLGYEATTRVLEIEFKDNGEVYRYFDVPLPEYEAFLQAPSKGTYLNRVFKMHEYRFEKVR